VDAPAPRSARWRAPAGDKVLAAGRCEPPEGVRRWEGGRAGRGIIAPVVARRLTWSTNCCMAGEPSATNCRCGSTRPPAPVSVRWGPAVSIGTRRLVCVGAGVSVHQRAAQPLPSSLPRTPGSFQEHSKNIPRRLTQRGPPWVLSKGVFQRGSCQRGSFKGGLSRGGGGTGGRTRTCSSTSAFSSCARRWRSSPSRRTPSLLSPPRRSYASSYLGAGGAPCGESAVGGERR
jgi:hypothetical protein